MKKNNQNIFDFSVKDYWMFTTNSNNSKSISSILNDNNLNVNNLCQLNQIHSNKVIFVDSPGYYGSADGLITNIKYKMILCILTADCIPIFIFDRNLGIYALIHAGWRGVVDKIHYNAVNMICSFGSNIKNINIFLGPSIKKCCFEIKDDIIQHFNNKYIIESNKKNYVDLSGLIINDFIKMNIENNNINYSPICSYEDELCYSYRRNSTNSRMYSIMSCK